MSKKFIINPGQIYGRYLALEEIEYTNPSGVIEKR